MKPVMKMLPAAIVAAVFFCSDLAQGQAPERPNILLISADDLGLQLSGASRVVSIPPGELDRLE